MVKITFLSLVQVLTHNAVFYEILHFPRLSLSTLCDFSILFSRYLVVPSLSLFTRFVPSDRQTLLVSLC